MALGRWRSMRGRRNEPIGGASYGEKDGDIIAAGREAMRIVAGVSFIALLSGAALCQPGARPAFDIADVHVSPRTDWVKTPSHAMQGGFLIGDRYELHRATMLDLIRTA